MKIVRESISFKRDENPYKKLKIGNLKKWRLCLYENSYQFYCSTEFDDGKEIEFVDFDTAVEFTIKKLKESHNYRPSYYWAELKYWDSKAIPPHYTDHDIGNYVRANISLAITRDGIIEKK